MKVKTLLVQIFLDGNLKKSDLELRHIFVDTIERRNLGEVVEVTSSLKELEIIIEHPSFMKREDKIRNVLSCLGFNNYKIKHILI